MDETNGIERLEKALVEVVSGIAEYYIFISGDLNARTGNMQDFINDDDRDRVPYG